MADVPRLVASMTACVNVRDRVVLAVDLDARVVAGADVVDTLAAVAASGTSKITIAAQRRLSHGARTTRPRELIRRPPGRCGAPTPAPARRSSRRGRARRSPGTGLRSHPRGASR